jgi:hypothetical protein
MSAYHAMIRDQLEEGLRELQHTANQLMHEIASEVWRTAGGDKDQVQGKLIQAISRDQTLQGLVAHTDERFQTLAVRTARLEDTMNMLAENMRATRTQIEQGMDTLQRVQAAATPELSMGDMQRRLSEVTKQVAIAIETITLRDRAITEAVEERIREHGELVATETARITQAMEAYVQQGVAAIGQLAGSVEGKFATIAGREEDVSARIAEATQTQMRMLEDTLRTISERISADSTTVGEGITNMLDTTDQRNRSLGEYLELMHDRVAMETRDVLMAVEGMETRTAERVRGAIDERLTRVEITSHDAAVRSAREVTQTLETRLMGLAELVRSDSLALRNELVRSAAQQDEQIARELDTRLGRVTDTLASSTNWMVEEITRRIREEAVHAIDARLGEAVAAIERQGVNQAQMLNGRVDDAVATIDRNMVRIGDSLEGQVDRLARSVGSRAEEAVARAQIQGEETVMRAFDARIAGLAKMVRSDNESLARQIVADQESSKQALRAMKELQASLPAEVIGTVQRRMDDLAESVAKSQEMLAQRIDRMASKIGERYDNDIQIVIDRMGDAMHALASLGRTPEGNGGGADRIELE